MRFEKNHVVSVGRFLGRQVLGNAKVVVFFGKNKKGPNDQSSKGVGCWLLVFWGRGLERNQKIFLPNGVREKRKQTYILKTIRVKIIL